MIGNLILMVSVMVIHATIAHCLTLNSSLALYLSFIKPVELVIVLNVIQIVTA